MSWQAAPAVRTRIEGIIRQLPGTTLTAEDRRGLRAVILIQRLAGADARAWLTELAAGHPKVRLTQEAKAALDRAP